MDATNGVPGRPLNWLPLGFTGLMMSLERADCLAMQLKAFSVTQAVKSLLSLDNSQRNGYGVSNPSVGFNRNSSFDGLRDLAKFPGATGVYGASVSTLGLQSDSNSCFCECDEFCECKNGYEGCRCGDPDCAACESCLSEDDSELEYGEHHGGFYPGTELQHHWGFPLPEFLMLSGPNPYSPKCVDGYHQVRKDLSSQRFSSKFEGPSSLERRGTFETKEFAQSRSDGSGIDNGARMSENEAQSAQRYTTKSPFMWSAKVVDNRKNTGQELVHPGNHEQGQEETLQRSKQSIREEKMEESRETVTSENQKIESDSESQNKSANISLVSKAGVKQTQDNATTPSAQSLSVIKSATWWPFAVQPLAAVVENGTGSVGTANSEATKWNFRLGQNAGAGALAGGFVSLCLHPIDTLKTIVQAQTGGSRNLLPILSSIISERGLKGLYSGLGTNLASSAPTSAIYTLTYESVKAGLLRHIPEDMSALAHCAAGACASVATSIVYTPSECVKQQMQVNGLYKNSWQTLKAVLKQGGLPMLYKGWGAVLCRNVPQSIIKFYTYEGLKLWAQGGQPRTTPLNTVQALAIGGVAGSTAAFFTTPFDVVKTRLQTQIPGSVQQYNGVFHAFQYIATTEGVAGLYRGLVPRLVIYVTQGALFFASYEFIKHVLAVEVPRLRIKASEREGYQHRPAPIPAQNT